MAVPAKMPPQEAKDLINAWLDENSKNIEAVLPEAQSLRQYIGLCKAYLTERPALLECSWQSLVKCFYLCARFGLIIGMQNRADIVPYKVKGVKIGQFQIGYEGYQDLACSGDLSHITAHVVYPDDEFQLRYGTEPKIHHMPSYEPKPEDSEKWIGAYSVAFWKDTTRLPSFHYLTGADILKIRNGSKAYQAALKYGNKDTPWITNEDRMWMKSTVRAHSHYLPITSRFAAALKSQDQLDTGTEQTAEVPGIDTEAEVEPTQTKKLEQELSGEPPMQTMEEIERGDPVKPPDGPITPQEVIDYMNSNREIIGEQLCGLYPEKNLKEFKSDALAEIYTQFKTRVDNRGTTEAGQTGLPLEGSEG
jgi:recombination protein RecT